jgi:hypothetical protein
MRGGAPVRLTKAEDGDYCLGGKAPGERAWV